MIMVGVVELHVGLPRSGPGAEHHDEGAAAPPSQQPARPWVGPTRNPVSLDVGSGGRVGQHVERRMSSSTLRGKEIGR